MNVKMRTSAAVAIGILVLIALLAGSGMAAWATPGQDALRATIPTPIPGDYTHYLPCLFKNAAAIGFGPGLL